MEDPLEKSLCYEQALPFDVHVLDAKPDHFHLESRGLHNEEILRNLASMDSTATDADENDELHQEMHRIEAKLDMVLDMLMGLTSSAHPPPPETVLRFNEYALQWAGGPAVIPGQWVELSVYLNPRFPKPLLLPGIVDSVDPNVVHFEELSQNVRDLLSRFIFRQHRRLVARKRGGA